MKRFIVWLAIGAGLTLLLMLFARQETRQASRYPVQAQRGSFLSQSTTSEPRPGREKPDNNNPSPTTPATLLTTPSEVAGPSTAAIAEFCSWAEQFLARKSSVSLNHGQELAWKRREAMAELIKTDPEKALAMAAPFQWRASLPANITRFFEQQVDGRGALNVAIATDFEHGKTSVLREALIKGKRYGAFVYGPRLRQVSQPHIPLHGIELDGNLAVHVDPIRILEPAEAEALEKERGVAAEKICGISGKPSDFRSQQVAAEIGGEVRYFCGVDHVKLLNQHWSVAASGGVGGSGSIPTAGDDNWTHGVKTVLYMRVSFPDDLTEPISEAGAYNVMNGVNDFYTTGSYDLTAMTATVTPLMTLPEPKTYYSFTGPGALLSDARETARRAGFETDNYDRDIACFTGVPGYTFGGLAYVRGKGVWLQSTGVGVTAHELGHNYGLWHANAWNTTNTSVIGYGTNSEYGNIYDTMGSGGLAQFNATHKNILDWLKDIDVQIASSNGVYRVFPFDVPNRVNGRSYAAIVRKDGLRDYWLESRQSYLANPWLQNGLLLEWSPWPESNGGTQLLDTTPGTPNGVEDAAITIGRTYNDAAAGVHITPLGRGSTGTNAWMDVQINLGAFPANNPPSLKLEIEFTNAAPGLVVHFHAVASDPDGDALAYAWSFDDATFSTDNLPWTFKSWGSAGEHVVRCVVSDMKGGVASANGIVRVGSSSGFRITGRVTDTDGVPLEGVRVDNTLTNGTYYGGYTDSDGEYIITGATGDISLYAVQYGFVFTNLTWTNSISATSDLANIDFTATPLPSVTIVASTNTVPENSSATHTFTLTRTGDNSNDLAVTVYLSGTADNGRDYTLDLNLVGGGSTNLIVIPAGASSVPISFHTINDSQIEGPETVSLTIREDPGYVPGYPGEATITILDDDALNPPGVSVVALTPSISENGMDKGTFQFSRTGSTQNSLTVFYSVSGTATPGQDYTTLLGAAIIPADSASTLVQFQPIDDKDVEPDETVVVTLSPNAAYQILDASDQIKILDDDLLTVTVMPTADTTAEPATAGRFTVQRQGDLSANLIVNYTVSGTATSGTDYTPLPGSVTIPAGAAAAPVVVQPLDDLLLEGDESVILTLTTNMAYNIGTPGVATLLIRDNEKPTLNISTINGAISEAGDQFGSILISRGTNVNGAVAVNLAISGSATPGADYLPLDSTVTIPNGANSITLEVIPFDDLHQETNETVIVTLLPSPNYNGAGSAVVTILDDDPNNVPAVGFVFNASSAPESQSPGVEVALSYTSAVPVMVDYKVIGGTASNSDYTLPQGTMTFQPGDLFAVIPLQIHDNSISQPDRTIRLVLFNPINATLDATKVHTYTILDDDAATVTISATAPLASENGTAGIFRISRVGPTNAAQAVNFQVTGTASAPSDYAPLGTSATIPAGASFMDLPVVPVNDPTVEHGETVVVTLLTAPGASIVSPNVAVVSLTDNDVETRPVVTITSTNGPYAVEGGGSAALLFSRSGSTNGALAVYFSLTGTAINGVDYVALTNVVTIPDGQSSVAISVIPIDDNLIEPEETVVAALTVRDTYRVADPASAIVTIQDNDQNVRLDASDFVASEPGIDQGEFTFTRFGTTNAPLQVFFTISGTASNGADYVLIPNSVVIPAGRLSVKLPVIPIDDLLIEGPETVTLTLVANSAYSLGSSTNGTVTIMDDEPMLIITASTNGIIEGSRPPAVVRIIRTGDPKYEITAHLAIGGTATFGVDYPAFPTNLHFTCGVTSIDLLISPTNELQIEPNETVTAALIPDLGYTLLSPSNSVLTILDAGTNQTPLVTITSPTTNTVFLLVTNVGIILEATVLDDSDTNSPPSLTWTNMTGATNLVFGSPTQSVTTASFTNAGIYVLRLTADDGMLQGFAEVTAVVGAVELFSTNILHWTFDEGSGTNVLDSSGAGRNGVLTGAPGWVTNGVLGGASRLAGTNDCVRQTPATNFLDGLEAFSVSLWVNSAATNTGQGILCANDTGTDGTLALYTSSAASCGSSSNVIEATVSTTFGVARYISASNVMTNGWQHLALTWSNGLAPALYINGQPDQPLSHVLTWAGVLTNCPQFVVGKGPAGISNSWKGWIDDVRVFQRALSAAEVAALAALPPANYGAVVNAGASMTVPRPLGGVLEGMVADDGRPNPPGMLSNTWELISGPAPVTITNVNSLTNTIQFTMDGEYVFRLISDDGQVKVFQDVTNKVIEPTRVDIFASDSEAAELGPDTGEFTFTRDGDTNFEMTVYLAMSGTASNGADFITLSNTMVFPAGEDTTKWLLVPFLDHRIEGDETFTLSIASNIAYSIGNGEATITIHDSPYGVWSVQHFTLEQLTLPNISGEGADFDHDGLVNFAEYAADRDPITPETNSPVTTAIELDPSDGKNHIMITYPRRLEPTDTSYAVYVSNDLIHWQTGTNYVQELQATDDGNNLTETVKAEVVAPYTTDTNQFVNVRVWLRATGP